MADEKKKQTFLEKNRQRRGMQPLDEGGDVMVSKPRVRGEFDAAADRRFRGELGELPSLGISPPGRPPQRGQEMQRMMQGQGQGRMMGGPGGGAGGGAFPPLDMRGPRPLPPNRRMGPPNPNSDIVPEGAMPGWTTTAQAGGGMQLSPEEQIALAQYLREMEMGA